MTDTMTLESLTVEQIKRLNTEQLKSVLNFARSLTKAPTSHGESSESFLQSIEPFDPEDLRAIGHAIEEGCEQIDPEAGK